MMGPVLRSAFVQITQAGAQGPADIFRSSFAIAHSCPFFFIIASFMRLVASFLIEQYDDWARNGSALQSNVSGLRFPGPLHPWHFDRCCFPASGFGQMFSLTFICRLC